MDAILDIFLSFIWEVCIIAPIEVIYRMFFETAITKIIQFPHIEVILVILIILITAYVILGKCEKRR